MNKHIFLLLGGNKLNYGILNKIQKIGYLVYVVDWNAMPQMTGDKHIQRDVKDADAIIKVLKEMGEWDKVVFAYSSIDLAVPSVAKINREIGLRTITDKGLKYVSSKTMMTKCWSEAGLLNRISKSYTEFEDQIIEFNRIYKLIIKPDNSASSRGITILDKSSSYSVIKEAFNHAVKEATNGIVVVEEFVDGTEFTVEMIGDSYGHVCVYGVSRKTHTRNTDNNKIAVKLHYNTVECELQKKIANYGIECYKALGFSSSLGHLELLLKEDGTISPIEIGARSSGFIISDLVDIVSGADFLNDLICVQKGASLENGLHKQTDRTSMYFFYDFPSGSIVQKECCLLDYCDSEIHSRYSDRTSIVQGMQFSKIDNDNARFGFEILDGPKLLMTPSYIEAKEREMLRDMMGDTYKTS